MAYLCIDTISSVAGITVVTSRLSHYTPLNPQMASEGIIESIDQTLKRSHVTLTDLKGVLVIKGPGSFTGLRVGISVANQFAHQLKIPILGLRTDEWWRLRTPAATVYLQSMNQAEIYVSDENGPRILPTEALFELAEKKWVGELKFDHLQNLPPDFKPFAELDSIEGTWERVTKTNADLLDSPPTYHLIEPFYGKEPNITQAKKAL